MPSIKRSAVKAEEVKTGFEAYDGPEPSKRGLYRAVVKQFNYKEFKTGAKGYAILVELEAAAGDPRDHAQFDGYPIWTNIIFGEHEAMIARESNLYAALGTSDGPTIITEDGDATGGVKVKTVGGKSPIGRAVNADIKMGTYEGNARPEVDGIYKVHDAKVGKAAGKAKASVPEPDVEEPEIEDGEEMDAREEELNGLKLADLREIADELGLDTKGLKKADIVASILDEEFGTEFEEPEEEEDDEEAEEEADEEDEEEEDEEEEDDEDEAEERRTELAELSRVELKKILKGINPSAKVLKSMTDEDLVEAIIAEEFESDEPPF